MIVIEIKIYAHELQIRFLIEATQKRPESNVIKTFTRNQKQSKRTIDFPLGLNVDDSHPRNQPEDSLSENSVGPDVVLQFVTDSQLFLFYSHRCSKAQKRTRVFTKQRAQRE